MKMNDKKAKIILVIAAAILLWPLLKKVFTIGAVVAMVLVAIWYIAQRR